MFAGDRGQGLFVYAPALMEGTGTFGPMSRPWKSHEIDSFKDQFGYAPTVIPTAIDMLTVYVHKDNPINGLSLQQVDAIFSKNRNGGMQKDIVSWGQLGLPAFGKANRYGCTAEILQAEHTDISKNMLFSEETLNQVFKNSREVLLSFSQLQMIVLGLATAYWL